MTARLTVYGVPVVVELYAHAIHASGTGASTSDPVLVVDGIAALCVQGGVQALFLWVLVRNCGARVRAALRRVSTSA